METVGGVLLSNGRTALEKEGRIHSQTLVTWNRESIIHSTIKFRLLQVGRDLLIEIHGVDAIEKTEDTTEESDS